MIDKAVGEICMKYTPYVAGEKIRIVFIYQVASFWPNWESFYEELSRDERFEVKLLLLRIKVDEATQTRTAEKFLQERGLDYTPFEEFDYTSYAPHFAVYQTPYLGHRMTDIYAWSAFLRRSGARIVYIPYGIEITNTESADFAHFATEVIRNSYRIYTFSEEMKKEYDKKCFNHKAVRALGIPKFDGLYNRDRFPMHEEVRTCAAGRKIVLWKIHFPKLIIEKGKEYMVSPYLEEYIEFAQNIHNYTDLFFVFMPHPKVLDCEESLRCKVQKVLALLKEAENVYIDNSDDYRNSLLNSDAIIIDRSAVMVEAVAVDVPVLYLHNADYEEPLNPPIRKLTEGYYNGTGFRDMENFIQMVRNSEDIKKEKRNRLFHEIVPYFDGLAGKRIVEDLVSSVREDDCELDTYRLTGSRLVVWGTGNFAHRLYLLLAFLERISLFKVVVYVDNAVNEPGKKFQNKNIIVPGDLNKYEFDYVVMGMQKHIEDVHVQLNHMGISEEKIINYDRFLAEVFEIAKRRQINLSQEV